MTAWEAPRLAPGAHQQVIISFHILLICTLVLTFIRVSHAQAGHLLNGLHGQGAWRQGEGPAGRGSLERPQLDGDPSRVPCLPSVTHGPKDKDSMSPSRAFHGTPRPSGPPGMIPIPADLACLVSSLWSPTWHPGSAAFSLWSPGQVTCPVWDSVFPSIRPGQQLLPHRWIVGNKDK